MSMVNHWEVVREGDWVSGTSALDERFIGYVDSLGPDGMLKVVVTQCDREDIVGQTIEAKGAKVKLLSDYEASASEELRSLIELALMTHDKTWFEDLRARLAAADFQFVDLSAPTGGRPSHPRVLPH